MEKFSQAWSAPSLIIITPRWDDELEFTSLSRSLRTYRTADKHNAMSAHFWLALGERLKFARDFM